MMPPPRTELPRPVAVFLWLVFFTYAAYVASMHVQGYQAAVSGGRPWYTDFTHTYASSLLVRVTEAVYLFDEEQLYMAMVETARRAFGPNLTMHQALSVNYAPWLYPPTFIFVIAPLAFMPYLLAYLMWLGVTAIPYLLAMRGILRDGVAWRNAWPIALASPTTYSNLMYGQTGFLSAGLIGLGLHLLVRRPVFAGMLIGLASVKPHLGLLLPVALAAGCRWRVFGAASATTLTLAMLSVSAYGWAPWQVTLDSLGYYVEGFAAGKYNLFTMTSVLSTVRVSGGSVAAMWTAQYVSTALVTALVAGVWWQGRGRDDTLGLQCAILCFSTPLAIPMVYVYDLAIIMPGIAWLWSDFRMSGARRGEIAALVLAIAVPMFSYELASRTGVQIGALPAVILLFLATRRYLRSAWSPAAVNA